MITLDGRYFKDEHGRTLLLRGVNLGGSSKVPSSPDGSTWNWEGFYDHRHVSFVGRPFPLAEADEHFNRLRAWGFTFLRFLVTWEAVEHAGPGIYDEEYLDYLHAVVKRAGDHGLEMFIDPHQDVWSRFTGGDGAPGWTLEAVGFNPPQLHAAGAAILHQEHGDPFPRMIWPSNHGKLAAGTMFTLFFGGNVFAPRLKVDGVPIQEYLQSHYINAIKQAAERLKDLPNVIGYGPLNEPSSGFIGEPDLNQPASRIPVYQGDTPTVFQGMLMGSGYPQRVDVYGTGLIGFMKTGTRIANPDGIHAWMPGREDIWKQHGVWDVDPRGHPRLCKPDYFDKLNGHKVDFQAEHFKPFVNRFARAIREVVPEAVIFVDEVPSQNALRWGAGDAGNIVHAAHWYDGLTLYKKAYMPWMAADMITRRPVFGPGRVQQSLADQVARIVRWSDEHMQGAPTLIGEVGIPYDMHNRKAYRTNDFSRQVQALDATMTALEGNLVSFTLWNYTADNTNERGDQWNGEDLSLFSRDQMRGDGSVHDGGRALEAAIRPYSRKVAGEPLEMKFDIRKKVFEFKFRHAEGLNAPTEIFIPAYPYPRGCEVRVSDGEFEMDAVHQTLTYRHTPGIEIHSIRVSPI